MINPQMGRKHGGGVVVLLQFRISSVMGNEFFSLNVGIVIELYKD